MERTAATDVADAGQVIQADVIIDGQTDQDPDRDPDGPVFIITIDSLGQAQNGRDPFLGLSFFFSQIFDTVGTGKIHRTLSDRLTDGRVWMGWGMVPCIIFTRFPRKDQRKNHSVRDRGSRRLLYLFLYPRRPAPLFYDIMPLNRKEVSREIFPGKENRHG